MPRGVLISWEIDTPGSTYFPEEYLFPRGVLLGNSSSLEIQRNSNSLYVEKKLNGLEKRKRIIAEKRISDILFEAKISGDHEFSTLMLTSLHKTFNRHNSTVHPLPDLTQVCFKIIKETEIYNFYLYIFSSRYTSILNLYTRKRKLYTLVNVNNLFQHCCHCQWYLKFSLVNLAEIVALWPCAWYFQWKKWILVMIPSPISYSTKFPSSS